MSEEATITFGDITVGPTEIENCGPYYGQFHLCYADTQRMLGFEASERFDAMVCWLVFLTALVLIVCFSL